MDNEKKKGVLKKVLGNVKLVDAGVKFGSEVFKPMKASEKNYPSVYLNGKVAPFLKDCQVGDKETFIVEAVLRSKSLNHRVGGTENSEYTLEIRKIGKVE